MVRVKRSNDERKYVSANLKKFRSGKYRTVKEMADAIGINYQQVAAWERGAITPDLDNIKRMAKHLGAEPQQITDRPDDWQDAEETDESAPSTTKTAVDKKVTSDDGSKDLVEIVATLTKFQSQYNNGELNLSKEDYLLRLQRVSEFIAFEYRDVTP